MKITADYFSPGIRMGLATAAALETAGLLGSAHVGVYLSPGPTARVLKRIAGPRVANRIVNDIPAARIRSHPQLTIATQVRRRLLLSGQDTTPVDQKLSRMFSSIARRCGSSAVIGIQSCCVEMFRGREYRVMEQVSPPLRYERAIAHEELAAFPGWAPEGVTKSSDWDLRMEAEWQAADLVWVPSPHLIDISRQFGADPRKFEVVPYPIPWPLPVAPKEKVTTRGRLRVLFAGTLMLEKGVQYIYEALRSRPDLPVLMEFFGPSQLTPFGLRCLSEVGTVRGAVPRSQLLEEFRQADILLFPSLSEGSALVTLEAAALGLPVVTTKEAGAPASVLTIPARSPQAIIDAIESLADDPARLDQLSSGGLAEAASRNSAVYVGRVVNSFSELTGTHPGDA